MDIPSNDYQRIAEGIHSDTSPVGIDAKKTHVLILHKLEQIERRITEIELQLRGGDGQDSD